jgi:hypothetical protein
VTIDLFAWARRPRSLSVVPWRPRVVPHEHWPPDYRAVYAWRLRKLAELRNDPIKLAGAKAYYAKPEHYGEFIMDWMDTFNPRKTEGLKWMPFIFFPRQADLLTFLNGCMTDQENGIVEKCRDVGVTWEFCAWSVAAWLFADNIAIGWGSRKEDLVDKLGIPDSIFEKIRLLVSRLPDVFLPVGFDPKKHSTYMKLLNPANGSTIAGESGDEIGRGGRKSIYFKDESAHYERPEKIEAALGDNTNVQIDVSSVNGMGNVFYRRAQAAQTWTPDAVFEKGMTRKFIIDWRDHPEKTQEWYDRRKARYINEGLEHIFAQEVDRNYAASVANTVIPGEWIEAIVDAHIKLPWLADEAKSNNWGAALDVADGGIDRNALAKRQSIILRVCKEWGSRDVGVTTRNTVAELREHPGIECQYDCIGVGSTVKSEWNRFVEELFDPKRTPNGSFLRPEYLKEWEQFPKLVPWNAGAKVLNPFFRVIEDDDESPLNKDFYYNLKAQAWWSLRTRCWHTYQCVTDPTIRYPVDMLISLDSKIPLIAQVKTELAQPTRGFSSGSLKMVIDKKPDNTKSPNLADAIVMAYFPLPTDFAIAVMGSYGAN